jgi:glycosyltransferase involved in cell wall biosynthesis
MRALEKLQREHPTVHALIVGGDDVSYGKRPPNGGSWREHMLEQVKLDPLRTHFMGRVPRAQYVRVLQVSAAHVYLTYPFVLSWSLLEAMACGCSVVASNTAPVREVIEHGRNGLMVDFFSAEQVEKGIRRALANSEAMLAIRRVVTASVRGRYSLEAGAEEFLRTMEFAPPRNSAPMLKQARLARASETGSYGHTVASELNRRGAA